MIPVRRQPQPAGVRDAPSPEPPDDPSGRPSKRKRTAKACSACHKSKRRCDGHAPCGNCYYASKECVYTDGTGQRVSAPFVGHTPERTRPTSAGPSSGPRRRLDQPEGSPLSAPRQGISPPTAGPSSPATGLAHISGMHPSVARELISLFFAHCHPQRLIIHRPSFDAALRRGAVPAYLLSAIFALAATHSQRAGIAAHPPRAAGRQFARVARTQMFDAAGRLVCARGLPAAQALCLLEMHAFVSSPAFGTGYGYHGQARDILLAQGLMRQHESEQLAAAADPDAICEAECARRTWWLIYMLNILSFIYLRTPTPDMAGVQTNVPLPVDETNFEYSAMPPPDYLSAGGPSSASEFGQLLRMTTLHWQMEAEIRRHVGNPELATVRSAITAWSDGLPETLAYTPDNLAQHASMFETAENGGPWCFCLMHVVYASAIISADLAMQAAPSPWAIERIVDIVQAIGHLRARNSILLAFALWPLTRCWSQTHHTLLTQWSADFEEIWELKISLLAAAIHGPSPSGALTGGPSSSSASAHPAGPSSSSAYPAGPSSGTASAYPAGPSSAYPPGPLSGYAAGPSHGAGSEARAGRRRGSDEMEVYHQPSPPHPSHHPPPHSQHPQRPPHSQHAPHSHHAQNQNAAHEERPPLPRRVSSDERSLPSLRDSGLLSSWQRRQQEDGEGGGGGRNPGLPVGMGWLGDEREREREGGK